MDYPEYSGIHFFVSAVETPKCKFQNRKGTIKLGSKEDLFIELSFCFWKVISASDEVTNLGLCFNWDRAPKKDPKKVQFCSKVSNFTLIFYFAKNYPEPQFADH